MSGPEPSSGPELWGQGGFAETGLQKRVKKWAKFETGLVKEGVWGAGSQSAPTAQLLVPLHDYHRVN